MTNAPMKTGPAAAESKPVSAASISPKGFRIAMLVALVWVAGLGILTWLTANPITLNWMQIQESDVVAVGKVTGPKTIAKTEQGEWPFADRTELTVVNLPETGAKAGQTYLFALTQAVSEKTDPGTPVAGEFFVTPTHLPNEAPLIYPATPEAFAQLKDIERQSKRRAD